MVKLNMHTPNLADENFKKLAALFPNAVTEVITGYDEDGKAIVERAIDKDMLMQEISITVVEGREERYQFTWPDKKKAMLAANAPISATLRPVRADSAGRDGTPGVFDSENLYIEGDNLDVLKLLRETYLGKVKMIYIDPPYNTGNDFIYEDDFAEEAENYMARSGQYDDQGNQLVANTDSNGRFHTDWLNMIYPRLRLAKDLLATDGIIFVSIDDNEVEQLKKICNEIFGEYNFITMITWEKRFTRSNNAKMFASLTDYILVYRKSDSLSILRESRSEKNDSIYTNPDNDPRGVWTSVSYVNPASRDQRPNLCYEIINPVNGIKVSHPTNAWKYEYSTYQQHVKENKLYWGKNGENQYPRLKKFLYEMDGGIVPANLWYYKDVGTTDAASKDLEKSMGRGLFDFPKPVALIKRMLDISAVEDSVVMDFFSGSATTAHAVMQYNADNPSVKKCRFIMVQLPEVCAEESGAKKAGYHTICEIGKERIRRTGRKIKDEAGLTAQNLDIGFRVLRLDSSNMQDVYYNPAQTAQSLLDFTTDNIKPDRMPEDLLFQVMLELGVLPSSNIVETIIDGKKVFDVADGFLLACFDAGVTTETVTEIAKKQPYYAVFRDSSMANDSVATNFDQIFETYSASTVRKVL